MRIYLVRTSLLWASTLLFAPIAGRAQLPGDSATLQIRRTAFAPSLHVSLDSSYQTWSGTLVRDLSLGQGSPQGISTRVQIKFRMWLADGTPLMPADTATFVIGRGAFIRGLEEGVNGMRVGGLRQLVIPSLAGWGHAGRKNVPSNAVLVAEVSLIGAADDSAHPVRLIR